MIDVRGAAVNTGPKYLSGAEPSLCVSREAVSRGFPSGINQDPKSFAVGNVMPKGKQAFVQPITVSDERGKTFPCREFIYFGRLQGNIDQLLP